MKTLLLIDAHSLIHRAYHAIPPLTSPIGEPVGAIYGVSTMLFKTLRTLKPDYIAAAFDRPEPTFRKEMFSDYKAHRPKADDTLVSQLIEARNTFKAFGISCFEKPGFEGDDIIGTLAKQFAKKGELRVVILTGDLDSLQLVEDNTIVVETPKKGIVETTQYDNDAVIARYGLSPSQLPDYKGLVGDPSDNIPGVSGVGPKTAAKLLSEYKTLEHLLENLSPKSVAERRILEEKETALFSKKLGTINISVPIEASLDTLVPADTSETLVTYFTEKGFSSLLERLGRPAVPRSPESPSLRPANLSPDSSFFVISRAEAFSKKDLIPKSGLVVLYDLKTLLKQGVPLPSVFFDVMLAGWLLDPEKKDVSILELSRRFLRTTLAEPLSDTDERLAITSLYKLFFEKLKEYGMEKILEEIEFPLVPVLASMEQIGIVVNRKKLERLGNEIDKELTRLTEDIHHSAGMMFNINSPKQVGQILFEKLELSAGRRKTAGGQARTGRDVLDDLRGSHDGVCVPGLFAGVGGGEAVWSFQRSVISF